MNQDIGFNVYLPPTYNSNCSTRFPVAYFFHGTPGDEKQRFRQLLRRWFKARSMRQRSSRMIYVFPKTGWHAIDTVQGAPAYGAYMAESTDSQKANPLHQTQITVRWAPLRAARSKASPWVVRTAIVWA